MVGDGRVPCPSPGTAWPLLACNDRAAIFGSRPAVKNTRAAVQNKLAWTGVQAWLPKVAKGDQVPHAHKCRLTGYQPYLGRLCLLGRTSLFAALILFAESSRVESNRIPSPWLKAEARVGPVPEDRSRSTKTKTPFVSSNLQLLVHQTRRRLTQGKMTKVIQKRNRGATCVAVAVPYPTPNLRPQRHRIHSDRKQLDWLPKLPGGLPGAFQRYH